MCFYDVNNYIKIPEHDIICPLITKVRPVCQTEKNVVQCIAILHCVVCKYVTKECINNNLYWFYKNKTLTKTWCSYCDVVIVIHEFHK